MSIPEGFASRSCFCLWSSDTHINRAIQDNHKTYLHPLWEPDHFYVDAPGQEGFKQFSVCRVLWSVLAYPIGMISYLFDTIIKVILLIGNFLMLLVGFSGISLTEIAWLNMARNCVRWLLRVFLAIPSCSR